LFQLFEKGNKKKSDDTGSPEKTPTEKETTPGAGGITADHNHEDPPQRDASVE